MKADGLFATDAGLAVVAEVKANRPGRYDTDPFSALVQALAGAVQLATESQQKRLAHHYKGVAPHDGVGVLVVISVEEPLAPAKYWPALRAAASTLAARLRARETFAAMVPFVEIVEVKSDGTSLSPPERCA